MDDLNLEQLAKAVVGIAERAGSEILAVYAAGATAVKEKADASPLTEADLRAHRLIVRELEALTPRLPILSEEASDTPFDVRRTWHRYWLVDPLDGTKEFISRNGEFTVNIALIDGHDPVLGAVHVPARNATYWGVRGQGAWKRLGDEPARRITVHPRAASPVRVVGSKSHRGDSLDGFLHKVGAHELVPVGSSLKFCMVAEGAADIYPRLGPTSEWDTAAAQAVVAAAGGAVVQLDGQPMRYNTKADILNPFFVVYADNSRNWLELLR
jgi:3'(2'), 5'-bisphosphate nucleotidase